MIDINNDTIKTNDCMDGHRQISRNERFRTCVDLNYLSILTTNNLGHLPFTLNVKSRAVDSPGEARLSLVGGATL